MTTTPVTRSRTVPLRGIRFDCPMASFRSLGGVGVQRSPSRKHEDLATRVGGAVLLLYPRRTESFEKIADGRPGRRCVVEGELML